MLKENEWPSNSGRKKKERRAAPRAVEGAKREQRERTETERPLADENVLVQPFRMRKFNQFG